MATVTPARSVRCLQRVVIASVITTFLPVGSAFAGRQDRALYDKAKQARSRLEGSSTKQRSRQEWDRVIAKYRTVWYSYPRSPYCDDSLLAMGELARQVARRFKLPAYDRKAIYYYKTIVSEYPSSSHGDEALYAAFEIERATRQRKRTEQAGRLYLDAYPRGSHASQVKSRLAQLRTAAIPSPPPSGQALIFNLRSWSGTSSTRVVVDIERKVDFKYDRLSNPERLWIDLIGTRLHPNLANREYPVGDGLLDRVRVGPNRPGVTRIVLDYKNVKSHSIFYLPDPARLVIDVQGEKKPRTLVARNHASAPVPARARPPTAPSATPTPAPTPGWIPRLIPQRPQPSPTPMPEQPARAPVRQADASAAPAPTAVAPAPAAKTTAELPPPSPRVNADGSYSIARQLGLGARTIVIDAGHGGHDPGSIGRGGLREKDLVLDVALRLARLVRSELGAEVILTRSTDVFVELEARTAIANTREADLFLSIHANSARSRSARGVETYFLNFAQDKHAESVAARENAISTATLKDLNNLLTAIAANSKLDESRDFATSVHRAMVSTINSRHPGLRDRGVKSAPFYVLIGAEMPSILAELAFVSNAQEEKLLKTSAYRDLIARSLLKGVRAYLDALNRTQRLQLTSLGSGSTVSGRQGTR